MFILIAIMTSYNLGGKRMKVKEMVNTLRITSEIEFRNSENYTICKAKSDSEGVNPYLEREVIEWFVFSKTIPTLKVNSDICLILEDEEKKNNER